MTWCERAVQILKSFIDIAEQTGRMVQMAVGVDGLAYVACNIDVTRW